MEIDHRTTALESTIKQNLQVQHFEKGNSLLIRLAHICRSCIAYCTLNFTAQPLSLPANWRYKKCL